MKSWNYQLISSELDCTVLSWNHVALGLVEQVLSQHLLPVNLDAFNALMGCVIELLYFWIWPLISGHLCMTGTLVSWKLVSDNNSVLLCSFELNHVVLSLVERNLFQHILQLIWTHPGRVRQLELAGIKLITPAYSSKQPKWVSVKGIMIIVS